MSYSTLSINDKDGFRLDIFNDNIWDLPDFDPDAPDSLIVRSFGDGVMFKIINPNDDCLADFILTKDDLKKVINFLDDFDSNSSLKFSAPNDDFDTDDNLSFSNRHRVLDIRIDGGYDGYTDRLGDISLSIDYRITLKNYLSDLIKKL